MEMSQENLLLKTYTLTQDEPIMGFVRNEIQINFQEGDQIVVRTTKTPGPGSLIVVKLGETVRLCRYEKIHGNDYIFPPIEADPSVYPQIIIGQLVDHVRLKNWIRFEDK